MQFQPQTAVRLLSGVPLDNTYKNQLTFSSISEQQQFFMAKTKYGLNGLTYQRPYQFIAVEKNIDDLYDCNYVMFQNTAYNNKWFYGFVTALEYKNDETTYVHFEVDEWQTWCFDVTINPCYVEREHPNTDNIGEHLIDEGLGTGDYVTNSYQKIDLNDMVIVVATTIDLATLEDESGSFYNGIYSGTTLYTFSRTETDELRTLLERVANAGKSDAIVEMYMVPKQFSNGAGGPRFRYNVNLPNTFTLNGYTPRNKKLLTYPYRACVVGASTGGSMKLKYEFFNGTPRIVYDGGTQSSSGVYIAPASYKGEPINVGEGITMNNYPMCSWIRDNYANWNAVQSIRTRYARENTAINGSIGVGQALADGLVNVDPPNKIIGNVLSSGMGTFKDFYNISRNLAEEREVHDVIPNSLKGETSAGPIVSTGNYCIAISERTITADYAKSLDGYFDIFGYKISKVKIPNVTGRKYWNYVKTTGAQIIGSIPQPSIAIIKNMFNTGVTFWHGDYVGNYNLDNSVGGITPPTDTYYITVLNGSGSGSFKEGAQIPIVANSSVDFKKWTSDGGGTFADATSSSTMFYVPANNCVLTPTYNTPTPPQPTGQRIDEYMRQFLGSVEWDSNVALWQNWYYGTYVKDAWCTTFLTYCASKVNVSSQVPRNENVQALYNAMYRLGLTWSADSGRLPVPGDICFFITSQSSTTLHHCGCVSSMESDNVTFKYISGNTTNPSPGQPDGVFEKTSKIGQGGTYYVKYFAHVEY